MACFSRARTSPALTTEWGQSTQTKPRGLAALVPSRPAFRCLLPGAARAAASSCAPCALNSLQRCSAPITCLPLRLGGPEPDGVGGEYQRPPDSIVPCAETRSEIRAEA